MSRYLITGGAGFIGSNLTEALLRRGHSVRVLDDLSTGRRENLAAAETWRREGGGQFEFVEGDVRDRDTCRAVVRDADFVLHQAAVPSVQRSVLDPLTTNAVNVDGTLNVLEAARAAGVKRLVFASSSSIYGESETLPKVETMAPAPISPYGLQKLAGETYCRLYHRLYGVPTVALRYFNVFGPRQDPTSEYSAVIPRFITAVKSDRPPTIYGDGEQSRDFTFIANVVAANRLACEAGPAALGRSYNVGCGARITLNQLVVEIGRIFGRDVRPTHAPPRVGDIRHSLAAIDAAVEMLGFAPVVGLGEGLERTAEAY
ncbi:MAG TPA: SDR family oxidoreductase [Candidatus Polarisedimenticolaceae bacterium]|nr:SDR family oxidoreductase [Candidatus Polarisedimenticolaceae bacterium]